MLWILSIFAINSLISFKVTKGCIYAAEQVGNSREQQSRDHSQHQTPLRGRADAELKNIPGKNDVLIRSNSSNQLYTSNCISDQVL